jgi:predicted XRE-type DNA-binding protein
MDSPDVETIHALRSDVALQVARYVRARSLSQVAAAEHLAIPQPTLSKIMNGKVADLSLELLLRIAVRAGLHLVLQTGNVPAEAGAFVAGGIGASRPASRSKVAEEARASLLETARRLSPEQRLDAHLQHNQLVTALHHAGKAAVAMPPGKNKKRRRSS